MAPKLAPDNLVCPDSYMASLDRSLLDESVFPRGHHAGVLEHTPNSFSTKYTRAPSPSSLYKDDRFITDIRVGSRLDFRTGMKPFDASHVMIDVVEDKHYLGNTKLNRRDMETAINSARTMISEIEENREEDRYPGKDVEIITLGTGSAIPNKYRNGIHLSSA